MADGTISKIQLPDNTIYDVVDNTSGYMTGMTILSYGSSTWQNFIDAYSSNKVVYCRASSSSNPASGSQTRLAFMAYVNNATTPTEVEFQYYRSVSTHTASQQGDQVYVYKLNKTNGWSVTVREASVKVVAGTGLGGTYSNGAMTLTGPTKVSDLTNDSGFLTSSSTLDATKLNGTIPSGCYTDTNTTYILSNALSSHKFTSTLTAGGSGSGTSTATMEFVAGTGITLTDDTTNKKITIALTSDIPANEIFVAEYDVTSYNDILSAYNAGKTIVARYPDEDFTTDADFYYLAEANVTYTGEFAFVNSSGQYVSTIIINDLNEWSTSGFFIPSITLNGTGAQSASFYAPTSAGTSGYVLTSNGSGAPSWSNSTSTPTASTISEFDSTAHMNSTDMTSQEVSDFVDELVYESEVATVISDMTDYIVEQGTSGDWTYRKWNSGIAECWCTYEATSVNYTSATGASGGYRATVSSIALPFTFVDTPTATATHRGGSTNYWGTVSNVYTTTTELSVSLDRGNSASNCKVSIAIDVKGRWK